MDAPQLITIHDTHKFRLSLVIGTAYAEIALPPDTLAGTHSTQTCRRTSAGYSGIPMRARTLTTPGRIPQLEPPQRTKAALMTMCNTGQNPAAAFIQEWGRSGDRPGRYQQSGQRRPGLAVSRLMRCRHTFV
jgi:hypothetical protein